MSKITNYEREYVDGIDVVPLLGCPRRDTGTVKYGGRVTFVDGNEKKTATRDDFIIPIRKQTDNYQHSTIA